MALAGGFVLTLNSWIDHVLLACAWRFAAIDVRIYTRLACPRCLEEVLAGQLVQQEYREHHTTPNDARLLAMVGSHGYGKVPGHERLPLYGYSTVKQQSVVVVLTSLWECGYITALANDMAYVLQVSMAMLQKMYTGMVEMATKKSLGQVCNMPGCPKTKAADRGPLKICCRCESACYCSADCQVSLRVRFLRESHPRSLN